MKWRIAAAMMLVSVAAMAQDTSPLHEVGPSAMNHGPATFASFEDRVDADARDYIARYPDTSSDRFVKFDTTMPLEAPAYEAMGKYAIVLVAAFSQNAKELPLGVVRAGDLKLHCVGQI